MMCVCGHRVDYHELFRPKNKAQVRRTCSVYSGGRKCPCQRFEEA